MSAVKKITLTIVAAVITVFLFSNGAYAASKTGVITGDVVNLRADPSTSSKVLKKLNKGTSVSVIGSEGDWYQVSYNDSTGWINGNYLTVRDETISAGAVSGSVVNVRSKPDVSSEVLTKLKKGTIVEIFETSGDWYRISIGEEKYGWVHMDYVVIRNESISRGSADGAAAPTAETDAAESGSEDTIRQQIVDYSKTLLGVKYVYGGSTPKGFDCSGFVCYVFKHFGITLERASKDMGKEGTAVKRADLQPGDLVFFDTNGGLNGINHVGIYIGNNKFIHASSNLGRKVTISNLNDAYYSKRYMRARDYLTK